MALLERLMASSGLISPFSFIIFPIQFPVRKVKSGKLWWTVPLGGGGVLALFQELMAAAAVVPDGDHLPLRDRRVQPSHAADVPRPLELLRVDEEERLFDPREGLVLQREHPGVQCHAAPEQRGRRSETQTRFPEAY